MVADRDQPITQLTTREGKHELTLVPEFATWNGYVHDPKEEEMMEWCLIPIGIHLVDVCVSTPTTSLNTFWRLCMPLRRPQQQRNFFTLNFLKTIDSFAFAQKKKNNARKNAILNRHQQDMMLSAATASSSSYYLLMDGHIFFEEKSWKLHFLLSSPKLRTHYSTWIMWHKSIVLS